MIRLPDGRRRSIPRSITDLTVEPLPKSDDSIEQSLRISIRTLLPLTRYLTARSSSLEEIGDERAASPEGDMPAGPGSGNDGVDSTSTSSVEEPLRGQQAADRVCRRRHGQADGGKGGGGPH